METSDNTGASIIEANDILEVMSQHNFPNNKQIELLQIVDFVLFKKDYPTNGTLLDILWEKYLILHPEIH